MPCQARRPAQSSQAILRTSGQGPHRPVVDAKGEALAALVGNANLALRSVQLEDGEEDVLHIGLQGRIKQLAVEDLLLALALEDDGLEVGRADTALAGTERHALFLGSGRRRCRQIASTRDG